MVILLDWKEKRVKWESKEGLFSGKGWECSEASMDANEPNSVPQCILLNIKLFYRDYIQGGF